ncbi:MAG TPA: hypothetical protein VIH52_01115 [Candidatus Nanoarchaeia archaeon]|nr:hypothetical protein [uncultured archaeon]
MLNERAKSWINKALLLGLVLYFVVLGYIVEKAIEVETLEPYGVNVVFYGTLLIISESVLTITLIWIFSVERSVWPPYASKALENLKKNPLRWPAGLFWGLWSAYNLSLIDLRLSSKLTVWLGRLNRLFAGLPLTYVLVAGYEGLPAFGLGLVIFDLVLTYGLWFVMEAYVVEANLRPPFLREGSRPLLFTRVERAEITAGLARIEDAPDIASVERLAWGRGHERSAETYAQRIRSFPDGVIVARNRLGRVIAVGMATPCDAKEILQKPAVNFDGIADRFGTNKSGKDLWGITLSVPPRYSITGASTVIVAQTFLLLLSRYRQVLVGSRVPDYKNICSLYCQSGRRAPTPQEYATLTVGDVRKAIDPNWSPWRKSEAYADTELEYYRGLDFTQVRVETNYYLRDDPPVGVILRRQNPLYIIPGFLRRPFIALFGNAITKRVLYK